MTAGHVLRELDCLRNSTEVDITDAALADVFGEKCISDRPIPFDIKNAQLFFIDNDELRLDFGVIPINAHYARLLAKNGVIALSEHNWIYQNTIKLDGYAMLGFPEELASERLSESGNASVTPIIFGIERIEPDREPNSYLCNAHFTGRVSEKLSLKSLKGMSGGLIIGVQRQPEPRYWIVGIQSSWNPQTRTVYGCRLPFLASLMTATLKDVA